MNWSVKAIKMEGVQELYRHPANKNAGMVNLALIREAITPVVFQNSEEEITDIDWLDDAYIRAVPNKFKYTERGRDANSSLYRNRWKQSQNKTVLKKDQKPADVFDLNTLCFGDSTNHDTVLSIKAGFNYSDALSLRPKEFCVGDSFHNRAAEDGTLWDAANKKNSDNIFNRHFILPGTLLVQVISTHGKVLPMTRYLLLSIVFRVWRAN